MIFERLLIDGAGDEFVVNTGYSDDFAGVTEFEKVLEAANWVAYHMRYEFDPPGDVWTSSYQQFEEIKTGIGAADLNKDEVIDDSDKLLDGLYAGTGDCEDFAILLCALMRFNLEVPADRVWVQAGILAVPVEEQKPPIFGHAYVVYKAEHKAEHRGIFYIEPQWGGDPYRGSFPSINHGNMRPPVTGESAMLRFNDEWVKGGGFWLAGPRK
jgi:hypothetical protein